MPSPACMWLATTIRPVSYTHLGFGTSWKHARPVAAQAVWMASRGVVITAALTGLFCSWLLNCDLWQGMLIGAVILSTDAASVFAILRSSKLNLTGRCV